jgi:hypothetical protein
MCRIPCSGWWLQIFLMCGLDFFFIPFPEKKIRFRYTVQKWLCIQFPVEWRLVSENFVALERRLFHVPLQVETQLTDRIQLWSTSGDAKQILQEPLLRT